MHTAVDAGQFHLEGCWGYHGQIIGETKVFTNRNYKEKVAESQKGIAEMFLKRINKECLYNLTLARHIESKKSRGK